MHFGTPISVTRNSWRRPEKRRIFRTLFLFLLGTMESRVTQEICSHAHGQTKDWIICTYPCCFIHRHYYSQKEYMRLPHRWICYRQPRGLQKSAIGTPHSDVICWTVHFMSPEHFPSYMTRTRDMLAC